MAFLDKLSSPIDPRWPADIRRYAVQFAEFRCLHRLPVAITFQVMVPTYPTDETDGEVWEFTPYPGLWVPQDRGTLEPCASPRYPNVAYTWTCGVSVHGCETLDHFRPKHAGGMPGWTNAGILCPECERFKWHRWPWFDYRPHDYTKQVKAYLRKKHGEQMWLWTELF